MNAQSQTKKSSFFDLKKFLWRVVLVLAGGFITAAGINIFLVPFKLLTAGVAGIALLVHYVAPSVPVAALIVVLNIPIFILGWIFIDRRFTLWSVAGMLSLSLFLDITAPWGDMKPVKDFYLSLIAGGLMAGLGVGLTFRAQASMGGTDIIAAIVRKYYSTSIGNAQLALNGAIVLALGLKFSLQSALASAFAIFFESWAIDRTIIGLNTAMAMMVITDRPREVGEALMERLNRGVTYFTARGGHLLHEKEVVYCIILSRQLAQAKAVVNEIDPDSFSTVMPATEVIGQGFRPLPI